MFRMVYLQVCLGSRMTKSLMLLSVGDIGTKFEWAPEGFGADLSITPQSGFVAPHSEARFELAFHPTRIARDMRFESLRCRIEGMGDLRLFVTGECVPQPESDVQSVQFECRVREEASKKITLVKNDTATPWTLIPVINNDMWKPATPTIVVPPGATGECTLLFKPLTMTRSSAAAAMASPQAAAAPAAKKGAAPAPAAIASPVAKKVDDSASDDVFRRPAAHEGTVFFALPNGRALLYKLVGTATSPALAGTISQTTPAKQNLSFTLPVANWLKSTQRFSVSWDDVPASTSLRGAKSVDVPALGTRDYKLVFYAYKPLKAVTAVKFTNDVTGEYLLFNVDVSVTPPGKVDTILLEAVMRQTVTHTLTLENPLPDETIVFAPPKCANNCVRVTQLGDFTGKPEGSFLIAYRPLVPVPAGGAGASDGVVEVDLNLHSDQLGDYNYTLRLKATPAGPEGALRFQADLGSQHKQTIRYLHCLMQAVTVDAFHFCCICADSAITCQQLRPTPSALRHRSVFKCLPVWLGRRYQLVARCLGMASK